VFIISLQTVTQHVHVYRKNVVSLDLKVVTRTFRIVSDTVKKDVPTSKYVTHITLEAAYVVQTRLVDAMVCEFHDCYASIADPLIYQIMRWSPMPFGPSVPFRPCPSHGYIWKSNQDRPIVRQVVIADSVDAFRSSPDAPVRELCFRIQNILCKYKICGLLFTLTSDHSSCQLSRPSSHRQCCELL